MEAINPSNYNPSSLLPEQNKKIEKITSEKCARHPQKNADLLHLKFNVKNARICISCV